MTPPFQEAQISQIPTLRLLQQLGYTDFSLEEAAVERRDKFRHMLVEDVLGHPDRGLSLRVQNPIGGAVA